MSSDRSRRQVKAKDNDNQRLSALEQLKRARQGGGPVVPLAEQPTAEESENDDEDDYESDNETFDDITSSAKRKSNRSHPNDSKRMKKKRDYSDEDDDNDDDSQDAKGKTTEGKRRGRVFAKQQDETSAAHDIKSMFAATKTRNIQRQEQNQKDDSDKLLSDIMCELQKPKAKPAAAPIPPPVTIKAEPKPLPELVEKVLTMTSAPPVVQPKKELDWGDDDSMSFDTVSKFMSEPTATNDVKPISPPRASTSTIQFDTQELEFVTDEQLLKSARAFHTSPKKENEENVSHSIDVKEEHLRLFWLDAYEDPVAQPGKLFLFGKTPLLSDDKAANKTFVSVCLVIDNIPKQVFFQPKIGSTASDVEDELFIIAKRFKITNYTATIVRKKRFDPDLVAPDVLNEMDYVEMKYPARCATLPSDLQGDSFQCIYGTNQQALEYILIDKKLKGPCWLNIKNCVPAKTRRSWCKLEYEVDYYLGHDRQQTNIEISSGIALPPPLVAVTLSLVTLPNSRTHETEVICVAGLVHQQFPLDGAAPKRPYQNYFVALTKPSDCILPSGLSKAAEAYKMTIETVPSERALLMYLISKFQLLDPDVIIGHDMRMFGLELFLSRCQKLKVGLTASKIGRLHRTFDAKTKISTIKSPTCGRLLCDISISARELLTKCKSYDLEELCKTVLNHDQQQLYRSYSIDQTRDAFCSSNTVVDLVQGTLNNTSLILNIFCQLMVLPLAYQLTCIAGNLLSRTLMGGRSERNDHLLLHAFTERDYIVAERSIMGHHRATIKQAPEIPNESDEEGDDENKKATKSSSTSYTGGLVLAPKKGFYDRFILLLDFNSLYPSIIQEFNVCFTTYMKKAIKTRSTADDQKDANEVVDIVALDETTKGILPMEIYKLVERRREVKKLIKEKKNLSDEQLVQYDIRQKAYKLTANSVYGCLGFKYSRFYCKDLAAFITCKGREILMQAKTIVERMNYDVIYGDTDSIMINTNSIDYDQVMAIGAKIRNEINRQYKNVEIGIDGVFKAMLLLKKKKYAALIVEKSPTQEFNYKTELKGLDIVRRDWCQLARSTGEYVVSVILSGQSRDEVLDTIHNRLRDLGDEMRNGKINLEEYEINRQLSKDPSDYSDAKSLPHVLIALRFNANSTGRKMKRGDTIAYIVCEDGTQNSAMQRGYLREEIHASSTLAVDINYYLHQQILPVVSRLLEPFDGTDQALLAQCLGLDSSKYKSRQGRSYGIKDENNQENLDDDDQIENDYLFAEGSEALKQCDPFVFPCPKCETLNFWSSPIVFNEDKTCFSPFLRCINTNCSNQPLDHFSHLQNRLTLMMNKAVRRYYQNWLRCEDDTCCAFRTRQLPLTVLQKKNTCTSCGKSDLITEYDARQLNLQLQFLKHLFQFDAYKQSLNRVKLEQVENYWKTLSVDVTRSISKTMNELQQHVDRMIQKSGYAEVCISDLFAQFYFKM